MTQVLGQRTAMGNSEALLDAPISLEQGPTQPFDKDKVGVHVGGSALIGFMTKDEFAAFDAEFPARPDVYDKNNIGPDGCMLLPDDTTVLDEEPFEHTWQKVQKEAWADKITPATVRHLNRLFANGDAVEQETKIHNPEVSASMAVRLLHSVHGYGISETPSPEAVSRVIHALGQPPAAAA